MIIYQYPTEQKLNIGSCVLALGFFDGVHIAHRDLLSKAREVARARGLKLGIFTFGSSGNIKADVQRLYDDEEKAELFEALGADFVVYADFSRLAGSSPEDFVKRTLCGELGCQVCVAGFNFRFGKGAAADSARLAALMTEAGGEAIILDEITADGITLSATLIRGLITSGRIEEANGYLGAPYYIKGRVLHGRSDGRKLGFPTANIKIDVSKITPKAGVYRTAVLVDGRIYSAVSNIGTCPTFEGTETRLEAHLIDFDGDLYGKEIRVYLLGYLREEKRFESLDELKMQINIDKIKTIKENGEIKWQHLGLK